jgi:glutamyl-tRNA synthetase
MPTDFPTQVRTRFAPSPTGYLHVGGVRTALFNWLFARHHGGTFILRIEDTDAARNTPEAMAAITDGLKWLGIDWDEGPGIGGDHAPYFQSQRTEIYERYLQQLLDADRAYEDEGAIRFRVPDHDITLDDTICGSQTVNLAIQGATGYDPESKQNVARNPDMVVRKPDGAFIFHFVNVVDDIEMGVTHVIRGEDHLSNTPRHLALYEAFDTRPPVFAHIPLILNEDGSKMSKRDTGASLASYIEGGFLPDAVNNFLCLLGWSPKDDREILPIEEITQRFGLEAVNRGNAKFDLKKCLWLNSQYLMAAPLAELRERATPILEGAGLATSDHAVVESAIGLVREKIQKLDELPDWIWYFFQDEIEIKPEALEKVRKNPDAARLLDALAENLGKVERWQASELENALTSTIDQEGVKLGAMMMPTRAAISGQLNGPGVYDIMQLLGRDRTIGRLGAAARQL